MLAEEKRLVRVSQHSSLGDELYRNQPPKYTGWVRQRVKKASTTVNKYIFHTSTSCVYWREEMAAVSIWEEDGEYYYPNPEKPSIKSQVYACQHCVGLEVQAGYWPDAACADKPHEWFFPNHSHAKYNALAVEVCHSCPREEECLEYALASDTVYGTFGGKTWNERKEIAKERGL